MFSLFQDFLAHLVEAELLDSKVLRDQEVMQDFLDLKAGQVQQVHLALRDRQEKEVSPGQRDHPASRELMDK